MSEFVRTAYSKEGVPEKYVRRLGSKTKPELKGKKVTIKCANCYWFKHAQPGKKNPCNAVYVHDESHGPITEEESTWYACKSWAHQENRKSFEMLATLPLDKLRVVYCCVESIIEATKLVPRETIVGAVTEMLTLSSGALQLLSKWAKVFLRLRSEKAKYGGQVVTVGSEWEIKDEMTGTVYLGLVKSSSKRGVTILVEGKEARKALGCESKLIAPDLFGQVAKPVEEDENEEVVEDEE